MKSARPSCKAPHLVVRALTGLVAPVALLGASVGPCLSADWTVKATVSESGSLIDNPGLDDDSAGLAAGVRTNINIDAIAQAPAYRLGIKGDLGYQAFYGEGASAVSDQLLPRLQVNYVKESKLTSLTMDASYALESAAESSGLSIDNSGSKTDRQTITGRSSMTRKLDLRNNVSFNVSAKSIEFFGDKDGNIPSQSLGSSISWLHRETKRTDFLTSLGADWYNYQNEANTDNFVYSLREEVTTRPSRRLKLRAGGGVRILSSFADDLLAASTPREAKTKFGGIANVGFDYDLQSTVLSGSLYYGLTQNSDGDLQNALDGVVSARHRINDDSDLTITARARIADAADGGSLNENTFSIAPVYTRELSRMWRLQAGYQFALQQEDDGTAIQNLGFLSLSRSFIIAR